MTYVGDYTINSEVSSRWLPVSRKGGQDSSKVARVYISAVATS